MAVTRSHQERVNDAETHGRSALNQVSSRLTDVHSGCRLSREPRNIS